MRPMRICAPNSLPCIGKIYWVPGDIFYLSCGEPRDVYSACDFAGVLVFALYFRAERSKKDRRKCAEVDEYRAKYVGRRIF